MIRTVKSVKIFHYNVYINDLAIYTFPQEQHATDALKDIYRHFKIDYPKFFKMDTLSKLGFLAAEILLKDIDNKEDMSIFFSTSSSSLETDRAFQETIKESEHFFPSPSVFVYTLPNIVMGEICIRHKIYGENMMCIIREDNLDDFYHKIHKIIQEINIKQGITGYIESYKNHYKAELILFENQ